MFAYIAILRPGNGLMAAVAVAIGALLSLQFQALGHPATYVAMLAAFLINGAGNAINDYADLEADKINRPRRPIPSGQLSPREALSYALLLFAVGLLLALSINPMAFTIAVVNVILLILYSFVLQHKMLVGNIAVSYLVGSTFLFGGAAAGSLRIPALLWTLAFLANLGREVVKDLEDVQGDKTTFIKRLRAFGKAALAERFSLQGVEPTLKHKAFLHLLAEVVLVLAVVFSPVPFLLGLLGPAYLVLLIPTDLFFLMALLQLVLMEKKGSGRIRTILYGRRYKRISKTIKLGMLFGQLAFLAGILV